MDDLVYESLIKYFESLHLFGYKNYSLVDKLILIMFIQEFINSEYVDFITEDDYRLMEKIVYSLIGTSCLFTFPKNRCCRTKTQTTKPIIVPPVLSTFSMSNPNTATTANATISGTSTISFTGTNLANAGLLVLSYKKDTDTSYKTIANWTSISSPKTITIDPISLNVNLKVTFKLAVFTNGDNTTEASSMTYSCTKISAEEVVPTLRSLELDVANGYFVSSYVGSSATASYVIINPEVLNDDIVLQFSYLKDTDNNDVWVEGIIEGETIPMSKTGTSTFTIPYIPLLQVDEVIKYRLRATSIKGDIIYSNVVTNTILEDPNIVYYYISDTTPIDMSLVDSFTKTNIYEGSTLKKVTTPVVDKNRLAVIYPSTLTLLYICMTNDISNNLLEASTTTTTTTTYNSTEYKITTVKQLGTFPINLAMDIIFN